MTVLADVAYINTGLAVLHRKRQGRALLPGEEEDNGVGLADADARGRHLGGTAESDEPPVTLQAMPEHRRRS
ncbi:hypothetical protein OG462_42720 [Streptomyces sp. NBC_01077]|uniref:hypothetical protein n=1 Tax=Streptomyces sp. NBC_01077 TaxID=2903746 RepID=UPI00386E081E|nr:hypothetical protein OG462_02305 [Streptomyces sp. NBC_01077]WSV44398.1 hypothetical protein OG462_42720 [Streptomyces sp. NBC_01077]